MTEAPQPQSHAEEPANRASDPSGEAPLRLPLGDGTEDAEACGPVLGSGQELAVEQLAAVRSLLGDERRSTEYDILINAALEVLRNGAQSEEELVTRIGKVWPGTGLSAARIANAMSAAQKAGLVVQASTKSGRQWALTQSGTDDVEGSRSWAQEQLGATVRDLQARLRDAGRDVDLVEAARWTTILQRALMAGVRGSFAAYNGEVDQAGLLVLPKGFDELAMKQVVMSSLHEDADAKLLFALLVDAINPVTSFCNELVSTITIGYMLQAFLGRRDHMHDRAMIASVEGDDAFLDTRVLLLLLASPQEATPIERAITGALEARMEVIAPEHYLEELKELVQSVESDNHNLIFRDLAGGRVSPGAFGAIIADDVLRIWSDALEAKTYADWPSFKSAAVHLGERLMSMGVKVQAHDNTASDRVQTFAAALSQELAERFKSRRPSAISRDANRWRWPTGFVGQARPSGFGRKPGSSLSTPGFGLPTRACSRRSPSR